MKSKKKFKNIELFLPMGSLESEQLMILLDFYESKEIKQSIFPYFERKYL